MYMPLPPEDWRNLLSRWLDHRTKELERSKFVDAHRTFHPFPRLPYELRVQIWEMAVEPRNVEIRIIKPPHSVKFGSPLRSWTPVPAVVQSCQEARNLGLYKQEFSELHKGNGSRYVYLNLDIDMISIGLSNIHDFEAVAPKIQRLRLERYDGDEYWSHSEHKEVHIFTNLEEVHVVCLDGFDYWGNADSIPWPCGPKNAYYIDWVEGRKLPTKDVVEWAEEIEEETRTFNEYSVPFDEAFAKLQYPRWWKVWGWVGYWRNDSAPEVFWREEHWWWRH